MLHSYASINMCTHTVQSYESSLSVTQVVAYTRSLDTQIGVSEEMAVFQGEDISHAGNEGDTRLHQRSGPLFCLFLPI